MGKKIAGGVCGNTPDRNAGLPAGIRTPLDSVWQRLLSVLNAKRCVCLLTRTAYQFIKETN
jgi:hypothetical protein